jgi:hypothetical protein
MVVRPGDGKAMLDMLAGHLSEAKDVEVVQEARTDAFVSEEVQ